MVVKVIGINKFRSKAGKECVTLVYSVPCSPVDNARGRFGAVVEDDFVPDHLHSLIDVSLIGKSVDLDHRISGGKAYMESLVICK